MIYLVKNPSGAEFEVTEKIYNRYKGKKEYTCRTIGGEIKPVISPYPIKDENSPWYTLSNGDRIKGRAKATKAQSELDG